MPQVNESTIFDIQVNATEAISSLQKYNDAIEENIDKQKVLKALGKEQTAEYAALGEAITAQKRERRELQKVIQNDIKMQREEATSLKAMRAQLSNMVKQFDEMGAAERAAAMSAGGLGERIAKLTTEIKQAEADTERYFRNVGNYPQPLKAQLKETVKQIQELTAAYRQMTDEERSSAAGQALHAKILRLTQQAGQLKDTIGDVNATIKASASDTRALDTIAEAGQLAAAGYGLAATAAKAFGASEEEVNAEMLKVQQAMQAVQALQVVQNTLQKESNLLQGIALVQSKARELSIKAEASATVGATVAQKAFNLVAEANPYVLLATVIGLVIAAIVGYTAATKEAVVEEDAHAKMLDSLNEKAAENAAKETAHARKLYEAAIRAKDGTDERTKAVKALQKEYPAYFANLNAETATIAQLAGAYRQLTADILRSAKAKAAEEIMTENYKKIFANDAKIKAGKQTAGEMYAAAYRRAIADGASEADAKRRAQELADAWRNNSATGAEYLGATSENNALMAQNNELAGIVAANDIDVKRGGGKTGKAGGGKTTTNKTDDATKKRQALANALASAAEQMRISLLKEESKKGVDEINAYFDNLIEATKTKYAALGQMTEEELKQQQTIIDGYNTQRQEAIDKFNADTDKKNEEIAKKQREEMGALIEERLKAVEEGSAEEMALRLAQLDWEFEQQRIKYEGNAEMIEAITKTHYAKLDKIEEDSKEKAKKTAEERRQAVGAALGALGGLVEQFAQKNKAAAVASKVVALGEIAINQGVAIAKGVRAAADAGPFPMNLAAIASVIATILSTITSAISTVQSAHFATGGYVSGAGTSTSDSIPARLSNGESVVNANSTSMFGGLLSSLNMLGGGVPIQAGDTAQSVQGEEMLARAFARGAAALPAPVVGVREFTKVSDRVTTIRETAKL